MTKNRIANSNKKRGSAIATKKKAAPSRATQTKKATRPKTAARPKKSPILGLVQKSLDDDKAQSRHSKERAEKIKQCVEQVMKQEETL